MVKIKYEDLFNTEKIDIKVYVDDSISVDINSIINVTINLDNVEFKNNEITADMEIEGGFLKRKLVIDFLNKQSGVFADFNSINLDLEEFNWNNKEIENLVKENNIKNIEFFSNYIKIKLKKEED